MFSVSRILRRSRRRSSLGSAREGMMKREDLLVAVDELLKMKKIEDILPGCFTKKNLEGFQKTLKQKKDQSFCKV